MSKPIDRIQGLRKATMGFGIERFWSKPHRARGVNGWGRAKPGWFGIAAGTVPMPDCWQGQMAKSSVETHLVVSHIRVRMTQDSAGKPRRVTI